jgi:hypothetical protein
LWKQQFPARAIRSYATHSLKNHAISQSNPTFAISSRTVTIHPKKGSLFDQNGAEIFDVRLYFRPNIGTRIKPKYELVA